ncbi:MAG: hypothetical protein GX774_21825 [Armatimonadetes bacterium]|nr:hypothetical protein [Armatimonadota bacterium]
MRALVALLLLMLSTGLRPAAGAPLRVLNLKPNTTLRYPVALISGEADLPHGTELVVTNAASPQPSRQFRTQVVRGRFKALIELSPGRNPVTLSAAYASLSLPLRYRPQTNPYQVRFIYFTDRAGDTAYQSERPNDPQDYAARLDTAAKLLQTFTAERMNDLGYGRKTFNLELDAAGRVVVHLLRGAHPVAYYHAADGATLWQEIGAQIRRELPAPKAKNVAIMAFSRFDPERRATLAHTALGGGDLALFGSTGLFSWPASLQDVPRAFADTTRVDATRTHDDSCFRSTYWAVAATTLGAVLHEVGHTFGLPHSPDTYDIMSRGFDFLNRAFTLIEPPSTQRPQPFIFPDSAVPYFGPVNAPRLAASRWFQLDRKEYRDAPLPTAAIDPETGKVMITAAHGIRVLGINSLDEGETRSCATTYFEEHPPKRLRYDRDDLAWQAEGKEFALTIIDTQGNQADVDAGRLVNPAHFLRAWRLSVRPSDWPAGDGFVPVDVEGLLEELARRPPTTAPGAYIDLAAHYRVETDYRVAYALCRVECDRPQELQLLTGSDDALRVWVNGQLAVERLARRVALPDSESTPVTLRAGTNTLLVEVSNAEGGWGFFLRLADPSGAALTVDREGRLRPVTRG